MNSWPTWDEWLDTLPTDERDRAIALADLFERRGAPDPRDWARSQISENIAQMARFLILRRLWRDTVGEWMDPDSLSRTDPARRLLASGANPHDVLLVARAAAYDAMVAVAGMLDAGIDWEIAAEGPGWSLMETDAEGAPTGRTISGLIESLMATDPSGNDGDDLWE
jgi:hypothetical protein